jgi:hypothetical protein
MIDDDHLQPKDREYGIRHFGKQFSSHITRLHSKRFLTASGEPHNVDDVVVATSVLLVDEYIITTID